MCWYPEKDPDHRTKMDLRTGDSPEFAFPAQYSVSNPKKLSAIDATLKFHFMVAVRTLDSSDYLFSEAEVDWKVDWKLPAEKTEISIPNKNNDRWEIAKMANVKTGATVIPVDVVPAVLSWSSPYATWDP